MIFLNWKSLMAVIYLSVALIGIDAYSFRLSAPLTSICMKMSLNNGRELEEISPPTIMLLFNKEESQGRVQAHRLTKRREFVKRTLAAVISSGGLFGYDRKRVLAAGSLAGGKNNKVGGAEWGVSIPPDWKISKKLDSTVRISGETVLIAQDPSIKAEIKINKLPLGRGAAANFEPEEQLALAEIFSAAPRTRGGVDRASQERVAAVMERTLARQVAGQRSATRAYRVRPEDTGGYVDGAGRRYVVYGYDSDRCAGPVDYDGVCEAGTVPRRSLAVVTVGLELQARTLQEKRLMEAGEMERREIDVLWVATVSAPPKRFTGLTGELLADVATSFELEPILPITGRGK